MKIDLNKQELNKCKKLLEVKELNICAVECYNDYLTNNFREIHFAKSESDWFTKFNELEQINDVYKVDHDNSQKYNNGKYSLFVITVNDLVVGLIVEKIAELTNFNGNIL